MRALLCSVCLLALSPASWASMCTDNFQAVGDARNGLYFETSIKTPGLSVPSALGQLRQFAMDGGYQVGSELIQGTQGELSFIQASNRPPLVIRALADNSGAVSLALKLAQGQKAKAEDVRGEFCSMLDKLKPGREGETIAAAARAKSGSEQAIDAQASKLSAELGKEVKAVMGPVASKGNFSRMMIGTGPRANQADYNETFAPLRAKYVGRKYRIDGQIYTVSFNQLANEMEINYLVTQKRGLLGVQQETQFNDLNFQITCILANDQGNLFRTLAEGNYVKLAGVVAQFRMDGMRLEQCRQAN